MRSNVAIDREKVAAFCHKWAIRELSLFGSVLRDDFGAESDVDLVSRRGLEHSRNYLRREAILSSAEVLHVA